MPTPPSPVMAWVTAAGLPDRSVVCSRVSRRRRPVKYGLGWWGRLQIGGSVPETRGAGVTAGEFAALASGAGVVGAGVG